jgi:hypothetical protein
MINNRITIPPELLYEKAGILKEQADSIEKAIDSIIEQRKFLEEELLYEGNREAIGFFDALQELVPQGVRLAEMVKAMSCWFQHKGDEIKLDLALQYPDNPFRTWKN